MNKFNSDGYTVRQTKLAKGITHVSVSKGEQAGKVHVQLVDREGKVHDQWIGKYLLTAWRKRGTLSFIEEVY